jgi:hypothetical protein
MSEPVTVLYAQGEARVDDALAEGGDLWLHLADLTRASGWALKPEGACLGEVCVPLPAGRRNRFVRDDGRDARFNLPELARLLDMPVVADSATRTWCFGESAPARGKQLDSLMAPDFTLPDLGGGMHALSDYRGKKVFLVAWASW